MALDDYGIGAAALAGLRVYEDAARGSGRTARMLATLTDGCTVFVGIRREAGRLRRLIARTRPDLDRVSVVAVEGRRAFEERRHGLRDVRVDHTLAALLYLEAVNDVSAALAECGHRTCNPPSGGAPALAPEWTRELQRANPEAFRRLHLNEWRDR